MRKRRVNMEQTVVEQKKKDEVENGNDDMLRFAPFFVKRFHNQENYTQTKFCTINIVSSYTMAKKKYDLIWYDKSIKCRSTLAASGHGKRWVGRRKKKHLSGKIMTFIVISKINIRPRRNSLISGILLIWFLFFSSLLFTTKHYDLFMANIEVTMSQVFCRRNVRKRLFCDCNIISMVFSFFFHSGWCYGDAIQFHDFCALFICLLLLAFVCSIKITLRRAEAISVACNGNDNDIVRCA